MEQSIDISKYLMTQELAEEPVEMNNSSIFLDHLPLKLLEHLAPDEAKRLAQVKAVLTKKPPSSLSKASGKRKMTEGGEDGRERDEHGHLKVRDSRGRKAGMTIASGQIAAKGQTTKKSEQELKEENKRLNAELIALKATLEDKQKYVQDATKCLNDLKQSIRSTKEKNGVIHKGLLRHIAVLENTLQANSIQFLAMEDGLDELYSIRGFTTDEED